MLNQAVKRNLQRFPEDFMFQMTSDELAYWKSQIVISNKEKMGIRKPPLVFTEQGVAMLSSVLNSERAILVNIQIIRIFTRIRELLIPHKDILQKLMDLENKGKDHNKKIKMIFEYLQQLKDSEAEEENFKTVLVLVLKNRTEKPCAPGTRIKSGGSGKACERWLSGYFT